MTFLDRLKKEVAHSLLLEGAVAHIEKNRESVWIVRRPSVEGDASSERVRTFWTYEVHCPKNIVARYNPAQLIESVPVDAREMEHRDLTAPHLRGQVITGVMERTHVVIVDVQDAAAQEVDAASNGGITRGSLLSFLTSPDARVRAAGLRLLASVDSQSGLLNPALFPFYVASGGHMSLFVRESLIKNWASLVASCPGDLKLLAGRLDRSFAESLSPEDLVETIASRDPDVRSMGFELKSLVSGPAPARKI